jgi:hypothetical protein
MSVAEVAHRLWSVHPREIQDMGITREQFYAQEIQKLVAAETERCAKIANERALKLRAKAKAVTLPGRQSYFAQAIEARVIAEAIRKPVA